MKCRSPLLDVRARAWPMVAIAILIGTALTFSSDHTRAQPPVDVVATDTTITLSWTAEGNVSFVWYQPVSQQYQVIDVGEAKTHTIAGLKPKSKHIFSFFRAFYGRVTVTTKAEAASPPPPPPDPTISITSGADITEGTDATFTISVSPIQTTSLNVSVNVSQSGEYTATGQQTVSIPITGSYKLDIGTTNDAIDEPNGSVTVSITSGSGYDVSSSEGSATVVVSDDDVPEISIASDGNVTEGTDASFTITASPTPHSALNVTVNVSSTGGYGVTTGARSVTIPTTGSNSFTVNTSSDSMDEPDGSVTATIATASAYTVSTSTNSATAVISDDDDPPQPAQAQSAKEQISHCLTGNILQTVRGYYNSNKNRAPGYGKNWKRVLITFHDVQDANLTPYTAAEALKGEKVWNGWKPVREAIQCIEVVFPAPSADPEISIAGSPDVTEGGSVSFTLTATPPPSANLDVSINVTQSGPYTTQTGAQTVTIGTTGTGSFAISTDNDTTDEPDGSVTATVNPGTGYTVSSTAGTATVNVADDDDPPARQESVRPRVTIADAEAEEGEPITFTVSVSPAHNSDITLNYETVNGSAIAHSDVDDYTAASGTVTISAESTSGTITISTTEDSDIELDDQFTVVLTGDPNNVTLDDDTATGTIVNDDTGSVGRRMTHRREPFIPVQHVKPPQTENTSDCAVDETVQQETVKRQPMVTSEGRDSYGWWVRLRYQPYTTVTLRPFLRNEGDAVVASFPEQYLVFTPKNWCRHQQFTVNIEPDFTFYPDTFEIGYDMVELPREFLPYYAWFWVHDVVNGQVDHTLPMPSVTLTEGSTQTYQFRLGAAPYMRHGPFQRVIVVALKSSNPNAVNVTSADLMTVDTSNLLDTPTGERLVFTDDNWNEFQDITITAVDNNIVTNNPVTITVSVYQPANRRGDANPTEITFNVNVTDND